MAVLVMVFYTVSRSSVYLYLLLDEESDRR